MKTRTAAVLSLTALLATGALAVAAPTAGGAAAGAGALGGPRAPGHPSWTADSCLRCHRPEEATAISSRVARPCRTLCASCHELSEGTVHHPVGVKIPGAERVPLILTADGRNTCVTCHDTGRPRVDSSPWESQSLFARLTNRSKEHPTRYLVMKNEKGQLCRNCH